MTDQNSTSPSASSELHQLPMQNSQGSGAKNWIPLKPIIGPPTGVKSLKPHTAPLYQLLYPNSSPATFTNDMRWLYLDRAGVGNNESDFTSLALRMHALQNLHARPTQANQDTLPAITIKPGDGEKYFGLAKNFWHGSNSHPQDHGIAIEMLKRSALSEYPPALYQLGKLYLVGHGLPKDESVGTTLLRRAGQLGLTSDENELKKAGSLF